MEKVAFESKSRRGLRGSYEFIMSVNTISKDLPKVLSTITTMNVVLN